LFRKAGYHVLLVDEYRTSKQCCMCQNVNAICKTFRWVRNPKRKSRHNMPWIKCHGLVRCTTCSRLYNRDPNSATNQWIISNAAINGEDRPLYVRRGVNG
jgi:transposase